MATTTDVGFLSRLRLAVSEATFDNLAAEDLAIKAAQLHTAQLEREYERTREILQAIEADNDQAHRAHQARVEREGQLAFDEGRAVMTDLDPNKSPELLGHVKAWGSRCGELGVPVTPDAQGNHGEPSVAHVLMHFRARFNVIHSELRRRYELEGEPVKVRELRAQLDKARAAEAPLLEKLKDARDLARSVGLAAGEAGVMAARAELDAATAKTAAIRAELSAYPVLVLV